MIINTEKLLDLGFNVEIHGEEISILPCRVDRAVTEKLRDVCGFLGFNESETEQFFAAAHNIQIMSAIRKCSNW